jgi:phospholipid-binding lipoprotein MlaA
MNTLTNQHRGILLTIVLTLALGLNGCATTGNNSTPGQTAANKDDPYENINRKVYHFNDSVDGYVAKPVADAYKKVTPDFVENNLKNINVVANDLLQGKIRQSGLDTGRFLMNSTLGMVGFFDVAKSVGLEQNEEDFEQTLAVWGVPQGSYFVLPLLGPITTRGIPGAVFDTAANPVNYVGIPAQALSLINTRANAEGALKFIDEAALDPYVFTRESFLQWRNHLATDGKSETTTDFSDLELNDDVGFAKKADVTKNAANTPQPTTPSPTVTSTISTKKDINK